MARCVASIDILPLRANEWGAFWHGWRRSHTLAKILSMILLRGLFAEKNGRRGGRRKGTCVTFVCFFLGISAAWFIYDNTEEQQKCGMHKAIKREGTGKVAPRSPIGLKKVPEKCDWCSILGRRLMMSSTVFGGAGRRDFWPWMTSLDLLIFDWSIRVWIRNFCPREMQTVGLALFTVRFLGAFLAHPLPNACRNRCMWYHRRWLRKIPHAMPCRTFVSNVPGELWLGQALPGVSMAHDMYVRRGCFRQLRKTPPRKPFFWIPYLLCRNAWIICHQFLFVVGGLDFAWFCALMWPCAGSASTFFAPTCKNGGPVACLLVRWSIETISIYNWTGK